MAWASCTWPRTLADVQVALKALHPGMAQEANARRRMGREVETMQRVRSRYVAEVLDADLDGDPPYIVTRYVPGLSLDEVVSNGGPLAGPALARLAYGLAEALAAVHGAGVVHRDLKPGNVMIADGEPMVIDFGIAHVPETTRLTMTGMFMGTPGYLAPEVIEGKDSGPASDVHSWAATVAFAATGRPPYGTGPFETIFYRIVHGAPNLDTLPSPLRPILEDALARDPARRPSAAVIGQRIAAIDPATLIPSPPAAAARLAGGPAGPMPGGPGPSPTVGDGHDWQGWPSTTKPLTASSPRPSPNASDLRELLPPVGYGTSHPGQPGQAGNGAGGSTAGLANGAGRPGGAGAAGGPGALELRGKGHGPAAPSPSGAQWPGGWQPGGQAEDGQRGWPDGRAGVAVEPAGDRHGGDGRRDQRDGADHRDRLRARRAGRAARRHDHEPASRQAAGRRRRQRRACPCWRSRSTRSPCCARCSA